MKILCAQLGIWAHKAVPLGHEVGHPYSRYSPTDSFFTNVILKGKVSRFSSLRSFPVTGALRGVHAIIELFSSALCMENKIFRNACQLCFTHVRKPASS